MKKQAPVNVLLEIGCEEIPARFMPGLLEELKKRSQDKLTENRISYSKVKTLGTPRRLTVFVENISKKQPDLAEELQGPPAEIAFDKENRPTPAAIGFAKKCGISVKELSVKTVSGRNYVSAGIKKLGLPTEKLLKTLLPEIISSVYLPLSMRWGDREFKFIRPIHWILALYDSKVIPFTLAGIRSSDITFGHRYHRSPKARVRKADLTAYAGLLRELGVMVDQEQRERLIRQEVEEIANKAGGRALISCDLLSEVNYLVETPIAYTGKFNENFLALPKEVLITSMKKNQKYFPVVDKDDRLTSKFVLVTDNCKNRSVVDGNLRVISARLSDAMFFFTEDKKLPLGAKVDELKRVEYFEKLGNLYDKTVRIKKLAVYILKHLKASEDQIDIVQRAAELSKADLVTRMVFEFPELQGVMGREYAAASGEKKEVGQAIFEHYLPRFAEDDLPRSIPGAILALADKLDTLCGCFAVGKVPTGSEDPYGLRRAAYGLVRIILDRKFDLLLDEVVEHSLHLFGKEGIDNRKVIKLMLDFIGGRVKMILADEKVDPDVIEAALSGFNDALEARDLALIMVKNKGEGWFSGIAATHSRLSRITKGAKREQIIEADLVEPEEKEINTLYLTVNWAVLEKLNGGEYEGALRELAKFTAPVENFFKKIMVMHEDERIKTNRLALLRSIENTFLKVADFTRLQITT